MQAVFQSYFKIFPENKDQIDEELSYAEVNVSTLYSLAEKPIQKRLKKFKIPDKGLQKA